LIIKKHSVIIVDNNSVEKEKPGKVQVWVAQTRANFLFLAMVLVVCGVACAWAFPIPGAVEFSWASAAMLLAGVVLAHISVNLFNEYSDYKTRIDFNTIRNPFSGGSGMLTGEHTKPGAVLLSAFATLIAATAIGVYFVIISHWSLLILVVIGIIATTLYTIVFAKILLGEFFAGFALGTLVVIGVYVALTASPDLQLADLFVTEMLIVSIPPGILTSLLLLLNEFPDAKADKEGGRFHLVIFLGHRKAAYVYVLGLVVNYLIIVAIPLFFSANYWVYLALATIPLAIRASSVAVKEGDIPEKIIPAMGINVIVVLLTDLLLAIGVFLQ
jgi:1,4-dihydroxy-2-naphthoate polyprenyltransferase